MALMTFVGQNYSTLPAYAASDRNVADVRHPVAGEFPPALVSAIARDSGTAGT
jgi:hypothetical protein